MNKVGIYRQRKYQQYGASFAAALMILGALVGIAVATVRPTYAESTTGRVVISAIMLADIASNANEYAQITNLEDRYVDVTHWCLRYLSSTLSSSARIYCIEPINTMVTVYLAPRSTATFVSTNHATSYPHVVADGTFSATLSGTSGHLYLIDAGGSIIDRIAWGSSLNPEGSPALSSSNMGVMVRREVDGVLQDTNNNLDDFIIGAAPTTFAHGFLKEYIGPPPVESEPPDEGGEEGDVEQPNDDGEGNDPDQNPPIAMTHPLLSELLPNPSGSDAGAEFIELYNPSDTVIKLDDYILQFGQPVSKSLGLNGISIDPYSYLVLVNSQYDFTLVNSGGTVTLVAPDATIASSTTYTTSPDGKSWALIGMTWQYTATPTPGSENSILPILASVGPETTSDTLTPCDPGQYRHPETNRCRKIASDQGSTLVPCGEDQERNPETNRCRNLASNTDTQLTPCKEGQERNPETNRCRNITATTPRTTDYGVKGESIHNQTNLYVLWVVLAIVLLGSAYIIWEWRQEILKMYRTMIARLRRR